MQRLYFKEVTIDSVGYRINLYTTRTSLSNLTRLLKLLGEPVAILFSGKDQQGAEMSDAQFGDRLESLFPKAVTALVSRLDNAEAESLILALLENTIVMSENVPASHSFDTRFQGQLGHLFRVLGETLKVQYKDFLSELAALGAKAQAQAR